MTTETSKRYIPLIAKETGLTENSIKQSLHLLQSGATIPFIARYRKEMTGSLDEVQIAAIRDLHQRLEELDKRKDTVLSAIEEQGLLTDDLRKAIVEAPDMSALEDLYLPYRPKRRTRATIARERGLEPLAKIIMAQGQGDPVSHARAFVDPVKEVATVEDALAGARDIMAEWVSESPRARHTLRRLLAKEGKITSKVVEEKKQEAEKYTSWFEWSEQASRAPSHRILAMFRGEKEGLLRIRISIEEKDALAGLERIFIKQTGAMSDEVLRALKDSYKRLLLPSLDTEYRQQLKEKADKKAIAVFAENLRQLLLTPPLGQKRILAIDPGFRTGCKVVCADEEGRLLHNETIYPHPPVGGKNAAMAKINNLTDAYRIDAIAIGNGTAGRETEHMVRRIRFDRDVLAVMVNESGASVYSASDVAREEFPDYDVSVRGAISIGRRLADPLAELVKIDPKSIGVGQYQHDVDQKMLRQALDDVVISCVNAVGVELNTASKQLLTYVSGVGPALAASIVQYRDEHGSFRSRKELMKVPRLGAKAYEQAAGFIRVRQSDNPLDKSAVHPESYPIVEKMASDLGAGVEELIKQKALREQIVPEDYTDDTTGLPTILDILRELERPGRDPRASFGEFAFDKNIFRIEDLQEGMILPGIVTNITAFGAFVDIGVHQDGLVHISHLANRFVKDPNEVVRLHEHVKVKVISVDADRKRIGLSMRDA